jgi:hypothetical protein
VRVVVYDTEVPGNQDIVNYTILVALAIMADPIKLFRHMIVAASSRSETRLPSPIVPSPISSMLSGV